MRAHAVFRGRRNCQGVHSTPPTEIGLGVNQSCGDMRAAAVFRVDAIVEGRRNCRCVHSTPSRETRLGCPSIWGDMLVAAVFRVDAIVGVSTPLHRGRQDWVVHQLG
ncbi:hypothetical protein GQ457_13G017880 [Hibiscus cannabinus]